ncbi:MAG: hypothetical protein JHC33_08575 [Ignisphaera sp.]|nr:hypothetical protein [Ignisphaera sp.]
MKPILNICVSCVSQKNPTGLLPLQYDAYKNDPAKWNELTYEMHPNHMYKAKDMYTGPGFAQIHRIIENLEKNYEVTLWIFSAGYGILHQNDLIANYDATFSSMAKYNKVAKGEQAKWLQGVNKRALPKGTILILPSSYTAPLKLLENLDDHILVQGSSTDRVWLGCSMIRCTTTLMEKISENLDQYPNELLWDQIRGKDICGLTK